MKRCVVKYMAKQIWNDLILPGIAFCGGLGIFVLSLLGIKALFVWMGVLEIAKIVFVVVCGLVILLGLVYGVFDLYQQAKNYCETRGNDR